MRRTLLLLTLTLLFSLPSLASAQTMKIAVVDFQAALNEVEEGKKARKELGARKLPEGRPECLTPPPLANINEWWSIEIRH